MKRENCAEASALARRVAPGTPPATALAMVPRRGRGSAHNAPLRRVAALLCAGGAHRDIRGPGQRPSAAAGSCGPTHLVPLLLALAVLAAAAEGPPPPAGHGHGGCGGPQAQAGAGGAVPLAGRRRPERAAPAAGGAGAPASSSEPPGLSLSERHSLAVSAALPSVEAATFPGGRREQTRTQCQCRTLALGLRLRGAWRPVSTRALPAWSEPLTGMTLRVAAAQAPMAQMPEPRLRPLASNKPGFQPELRSGMPVGPSYLGPCQ
jgi:hypothetical protein